MRGLIDFLHPLGGDLRGACQESTPDSFVFIGVNRLQARHGSQLSIFCCLTQFSLTPFFLI